MNKKKKYSDKEINLIKTLYPNCPTKCICSIINRTYASVRKIAVKNGIKKNTEYISKVGKKTGFQKENITNAKPIGHEKLNGLGYIDIKVKEYSRLVLKHHYVYEQNFGKIPKGHIVIFKDKNTLNFKPSNLEAITREENMKRNTIQRYPISLKKALFKHSKLKKLIHAKSEQLRRAKQDSV